MHKLKLRSILCLFFLLNNSFSGQAQTKVLLDNYYNNEINESTGKSFHYLWNDTEISGFSKLGDLFKINGAELATLKEKPTAFNLKKANIYILVDPDTKLETISPNYMDETTAQQIDSWVKKGGILVMLTNDYEHAELDSFNVLAEKFGMKFENKILHLELSKEGSPRNFNSCASANLNNHILFSGVSKIFLKEIAPIKCTYPAKAVLQENGQNIMAEANYGKGYVFAIGDPWLYNEYFGCKILPEDFNNEKAASNLVKLLISKQK